MSSMARSSTRATETPNTTLHDLDRLLQRLERTLLSEDADSHLRNSPYNRRKIGANVEYARTLLLRLEHETTSIKLQPRRASQTADLSTKRDLIKRLNRRLLELDQLDEDEVTSSVDSTSSEDESSNGTQSRAVQEFAPARQDTANGLDIAPSTADTHLSNIDSALRARKPQSATATDTATTTSRSALFSGRSDGSIKSPSAADPSAQKHTETLLDHHRVEQETLTASLVGLAQALRQSTVQFSQSLESEKDVLGAAEGGLDRNALGMEAAGRRMGTLRRMTEGQGFLGRLKLYAMIAALWVAAFLLVFVGPKLRF